MKTKPSTIISNYALTNYVVKTIFTSSSLILLILLFLGCKNKTLKSEIAEVLTNSKNKVHMAFAGGGWRAHTGHSAWTISLLANENKPLSSIFSNVGTMSSNSGGSWFSTMLMYSDDFVADIEDKKAIDTWTTTGWIGQQRKHFDAVSCDDYPEGLYLECVFDSYTNKSYTGGTYWKLLVEKLIYKDYPLTGVMLSDAHQPWAADKPLLLASSLLNNAVVLNSVDDLENNHRYYQGCLSPGIPILNADSGSSCSLGTPVDVTPATFSSVPKSLNYLPSPFFSELGTTASSSQFNLGYTEDYVHDSPPKLTTSVTLPLNVNDVSVETAAAASSAALGFGASERITQSFDLSYIFEDDAVSFSLADSKVQYFNAEGIALRELANNKVVRLADGGGVDNSGVAQLVRSLQLNNQADGFNIIAFDNVSTITDPGGGGAKVGIDIASLFGYQDPLCVNLKLTKYCINTPNLQIFDSTSLTSTKATWAYEVGGNELVYTKYAITTMDNPVLGIAGQTKGTLHSFTCAYPNAETAPIDGDANFDAYDAMFYFIHAGLIDKGNAGLNHLRTALGL
jgi:hypothetical protein